MEILIVIFILTVATASSLYCQNRTIKGRVIDNHKLEPLPFVVLRINDTVEIDKTDLNGFFQVDIPVSVNKLAFDGPGLELTPVRLIDTCNEVELVMMLSGTYDFMTFKQVDRFRKKKFKKLPELHKTAFVKGIFKTDKPCYTREFIPYYRRKNKS